MLQRPIRVAVTIGPAGHGGTATYSRELVRALVDRPDVHVTTIGSSEALAELDATPHDHVGVPADRVREQMSVALVGKRLRHVRVDLVHGTRQLLPVGTDIPAVITFHDDFILTRRHDYDLVKRILLPPLFRRSLARADAVVTLHEATATVARAYVRPGVPVVNAGASVPSSLARATPRAPHEALPREFALVVGDANPRKNIDGLLDEWPRIAERFGLGLVVAGGRAASPSLLERLRAGHPAVFVHVPDDGVLSYLYRGARVVVDPAHDEGFGFSRVEAEHFGVPFAAARDHGDLTAAVAVALSHRSRSGLAMPTSWSSVADRTVAVYRDALATRPE